MQTIDLDQCGKCGDYFRPGTYGSSAGVCARHNHYGADVDHVT